MCACLCVLVHVCTYYDTHTTIVQFGEDLVDLAGPPRHDEIGQVNAEAWVLCLIMLILVCEF